MAVKGEPCSPAVLRAAVAYSLVVGLYFGGYQYSLCPAGEAVTEQCFHKLPLAFVGSTHTIRYLDNGTEFPIPATDVSVGTWPQGRRGASILFRRATATRATAVWLETGLP